MTTSTKTPQSMSAITATTLAKIVHQVMIALFAMKLMTIEFCLTESLVSVWRTITNNLEKQPVDIVQTSYLTVLTVFTILLTRQPTVQQEPFSSAVLSAKKDISWTT